MAWAGGAFPHNALETTHYSVDVLFRTVITTNTLLDVGRFKTHDEPSAHSDTQERCLTQSPGGSCMIINEIIEIAISVGMASSMRRMI